MRNYAGGVRVCRSPAGLALLTVLTVTLAGGCGAATAPPNTTGAVTPGPPGQLLESPTAARDYDGLDTLAATAVKIRYRSTSGSDGSPTSVSAVLFVPPGEPPPGGWIVASVAHATAGVTSDCAPSAAPDLLGSVPQVAMLLSAGFAVVLSDYQGLGGPGGHPYLEPKSAAYNVIDAVRAAREAIPDTSDTWVGYGYSQGGQAAWAANEETDGYGKGLHLAAVVAVAPATDLRPLADAVADGTLSTDQIKLLPLLLEGLRATHPDFDPADYSRGALAAGTEVLLQCTGVDDERKGQIAESVTPADYLPATSAAADRLRELLGADSLPTRRTAAPMLVVFGEQDPIMSSEWTIEGVHQACALGDVLDVRRMPGQGHDVSPPMNPADWIRDRLSGIPPADSCVMP